jgi:hypothetical protein
VRRLLLIVGMTVVTFFLATFGFWGLGCACDGPNRFAGVDPFRDRAPERAAQDFFRELSSGRCTSAEEVLCQQALRNGRVTNWELVTRETKGGHTILYYDIRYEDPAGWPTGVSLELEATIAGWKVVSYSGIHWR